MPSCELPQINAKDDEISKILSSAKTVAIIGLSANPEQESYMVALYLKEKGYTIIPVNPKYPEILGEKCYPSVKDIPVQIDIVNVFRRPDAIPAVAQEVLQMKKKPKVFWMQLGIAHNESAALLQKAKITVVQSKCIKMEHAKLLQ